MTHTRRTAWMVAFVVVALVVVWFQSRQPAFETELINEPITEVSLPIQLSYRVDAPIIQKQMEAPLDQVANSAAGQNCFVANDAISVQNESLLPLNANLNWWGAADGPSGAGTGRGDVVGPNVLFENFLDVSPDGCPPSNAYRDHAFEILSELPFTYTQSTAFAPSFVTDPVPSCVAEPLTHTVWYHYQTESPQVLNFSTGLTDYDTVLSVWQANGDVLTELGCADSDDLALSLPTDADIYVMVAGKGSGGNLELAVAETTYADLSVSISAVSEITLDGLHVHYDVSAVNNGAFTDLISTLTFDIPQQSTVTAFEPQSNCALNGSRITCTFAPFAVGTQVLTGDTSVQSGAGGPLVVQADILGTLSDPDLNNNSITVNLPFAPVVVTTITELELQAAMTDEMNSNPYIRGIDFVLIDLTVDPPGANMTVRTTPAYGADVGSVFIHIDTNAENDFITLQLDETMTPYETEAFVWDFQQVMNCELLPMFVSALTQVADHKVGYGNNLQFAQVTNQTIQAVYTLPETPVQPGQRTYFNAEGCLPEEYPGEPALEMQMLVEGGGDLMEAPILLEATAEAFIVEGTPQPLQIEDTPITLQQEGTPIYRTYTTSPYGTGQVLPDPGSGYTPNNDACWLGADDDFICSQYYGVPATFEYQFVFDQPHNFTEVNVSYFDLGSCDPRYGCRKPACPAKDFRITVTYYGSDGRAIHSISELSTGGGISFTDTSPVNDVTRILFHIEALPYAECNPDAETYYSFHAGGGLSLLATTDECVENCVFDNCAYIKPSVGHVNFRALPDGNAEGIGVFYSYVKDDGSWDDQVRWYLTPVGRAEGTYSGQLTNIWYLVDFNTVTINDRHYTSRGWIHGANVLFSPGCSFLPNALPQYPSNKHIMRGPSEWDGGISSDALLPVSSLDAQLPSPEDIWAPFGICDAWKPSDVQVPKDVAYRRSLQIQRRCAFESYVYFYDFVSREYAGDTFSLADLYAVAYLHELGATLTKYQNGGQGLQNYPPPYDHLTTEDQYRIEASIRNFAQLCIQGTNSDIDYVNQFRDPDGQLLPDETYTSINCNIDGIMQYLSQLKPWIDGVNPASASESIMISYLDELDRIAPVVLPILQDKVDWYRGAQGNRPFTWGNFCNTATVPEGQTKNGYNLIMDQWTSITGYTHIHVNTVEELREFWVTQGNDPVLDKIFYGEETLVGTSIDLFVITVNRPGYGETAFCSPS